MDKQPFSTTPGSSFEAPFKLPIAERLQLFEDRWDSIARDTNPDVAEVARRALLRRHESFEAEPASGISWEQAKQRLLES